MSNKSNTKKFLVVRKGRKSDKSVRNWKLTQKYVFILATLRVAQLDYMKKYKIQKRRRSELISKNRPCPKHLEICIVLVKRVRLKLSSLQRITWITWIRSHVSRCNKLRNENETEQTTICGLFRKNRHDVSLRMCVEFVGLWLGHLIIGYCFNGYWMVAVKHVDFSETAKTI